LLLHAPYQHKESFFSNPTVHDLLRRIFLAILANLPSLNCAPRLNVASIPPVVRYAAAAVLTNNEPKSFFHMHFGTAALRRITG
jgi:hypothetical protein